MEVVPIQISGMNVEVNLPGFSKDDKKNSRRATMSIIRSAVCAQQGIIAEYMTLSSERHKDLRLSVEAAERTPGNHSLTKVIEAKIKFDRRCADSIKKSWASIVRFSEPYFLATHKNSMPPRLCIKGMSASGDVSDNQKVHDILRENSTRSSAVQHVWENTGLSSVLSTGLYYRENNIPKVAANGKYKNPRINPSEAKHYKAPIPYISRKFYKQSDDDWVQCWNDGNVNSPPSSYYKSTLIVPMTLANNELSVEFQQDSYVGLESRNIYGFICFDHSHASYFSDEDVNFGYLFADLLSLFFIQKSALTQYSEVYARAENIIKRKN